MKKINVTIITVIASLITIAFLILVNNIMISIRLNELRSSLQGMDRKEGSIDNISLVATYEIHKKLFENRISQEEADALEQKINSLVILENDTPYRLDALRAMITLPALAVINFNRMILGKPSLSYFQSGESGHVNIDLAYFYERNFHFSHAIQLYDKSLAEDNLNSSLRAGVLLHTGYCYALSGFNDKARSYYLKVINTYSQESSAITATILLGYLEGFMLARERVLNSKEDPLLTSQNLVNLLAYKQALLVLKTAESGARPEELPRIKYFMARCFSGMGDTNKAVENYLQVITSSPSSRYAILSNRKLFIAGSSGDDEKLQQISIKLNRIFNDPVLGRMIKNRGIIKTNITMQEKTVKIDIPPDLKTMVDTLMSNKSESRLEKNRYFIIFTNDGNIFRGTLINQTADRITIMTSIGRIDVSKEKIVKITEK